MKPTQIRCSEGSINQIPAWAEVQGDIRLTPFYNIQDCLNKVRGYVEDMNNGQSEYTKDSLPIPNVAAVTNISLHAHCIHCLFLMLQL